jgi:hypothetical protein
MLTIGSIGMATAGARLKHIRRKLDLHDNRELLACARKWDLDSTRTRGVWL